MQLSGPLNNLVRLTRMIFSVGTYFTLGWPNHCFLSLSLLVPDVVFHNIRLQASFQGCLMQELTIPSSKGCNKEHSQMEYSAPMPRGGRSDADFRFQKTKGTSQAENRGKKVSNI